MHNGDRARGEARDQGYRARPARGATRPGRGGEGGDGARGTRLENEIENDGEEAMKTRARSNNNGKRRKMCAPRPSLLSFSASRLPPSPLGLSGLFLSQ